MRNAEIFELEDIFLNKNNNIIHSGQSMDSRPPGAVNSDLQSEFNEFFDLNSDRKLLIASLIIVFILGFICAKIIS